MRDGEMNFINISNNYQYAAQGGMFYELKPALKANFILEQIESKYSINFTGGFWNTDAWQDMYVWSATERKDLVTISRWIMYSLQEALNLEEVLRFGMNRQAF
jgi:hypothetical protein